MLMKHRLLFSLLVLIIGGNMPLMADLTDGPYEYEVPVGVQLLNGNEFPGVKFYFRYEHWSENDPIDPDSITKKFLLRGKPVEVGETNGKHLFAEDEKGNIYESDTALGGIHFLDYDLYQQFVHQIRVVSLANGVIKIKTVALVEKDENGKVLKVSKGNMGSRYEVGIWAIPLVSLLGLIAFFFLRRRIATNPGRR